MAAPIVCMILDQVLERYRAAAKTPQATPAGAAPDHQLDANLVAAIDVAGNEFGRHSQHHKAIAHVLCALRGVDVALYYRPKPLRPVLNVGWFYKVEDCRPKYNFRGSTLLTVSDVDSDGDVRILRVDDGELVYGYGDASYVSTEGLVLSPASDEEAAALVRLGKATRLSAAVINALGQAAAVIDDAAPAKVRPKVPHVDIGAEAADPEEAP